MKVSNELLLERIDNVKSDIGDVKVPLRKIKQSNFQEHSF